MSESAVERHTRCVRTAVAHGFVLLRPDGGHDVLHGAHPRYGGVLQDGQIVFGREFRADLAPIAQKAALGEQQDPRPVAGQIRPSEMTRQFFQ